MYKQQEIAYDGIVKEVLSLDREWCEAYLQCDSKVFERILADDFVATGANGTVRTKAQLLALMVNSAIKFKSVIHDDVDVRSYVNGAVKTGRTTLTELIEFRPFNTQYRYTMVCIQRYGLWQVLASQLTKINDAM